MTAGEFLHYLAEFILKFSDTNLGSAIAAAAFTMIGATFGFFISRWIEAATRKKAEIRRYREMLNTVYNELAFYLPKLEEIRDLLKPYVDKQRTADRLLEEFPMIHTVCPLLTDSILGLKTELSRVTSSVDVTQAIAQCHYAMCDVNVALDSLRRSSQGHLLAMLPGSYSMRPVIIDSMTVVPKIEKAISDFKAAIKVIDGELINLFSKA